MTNIKSKIIQSVLWLFLGTWSLGLGTLDLYAQQLPYYTQFKPNNALLNPAITGTKRIIDGRVFYRKQWVGFDASPSTSGLSLHSRLFRGSMGLGTAFFSDKTGPTKRSDLMLAYAWHGTFEDVELSVGAAYHRLSYHLDGTLLNLHVPADNVIDLTAYQKKSVNNASAGLLFYNDRFHVGVSLLNLLEPSINFFEKADTIHKTKIHMVPHLYGSVGYNWSGQPDWIWENSLQATYAQANPMTIDYNLRLHYKQKLLGGFSIRLRDAIALHLGTTFLEDFHVSYSYDLVVSSLRFGQSGSHEILLAYSTDLGKQKRTKYNIDRFKKQKYGFMF